MGSNDPRRPLPCGSELATELDATGLEAGLGDFGPAAETRVYLIVQSSNEQRLVEIGDGEQIVVGRDADCDLVVDQAKVSRRHFAVRRRDPRVEMEDLESTNGTRLNGATVRGGVRQLVGGDVLRVGATTLTIATATTAAHGAEPDDEGDLPQGVCLADPAMVKVFRVAQRVARADTTVLILGETGVGKEVLAEQVHRASARAERPYVRLNCASLPDALLSSELFGHERGAFTGAERRKIGFFEAADGGSLLLDEIGELSASMQVKLLRVLENRTVMRLGGTEEIPVDVRVICATHRNLEAEVQAGRFREDLFYRVSAFVLQVPPLRERPLEVGLLAELFAKQLAAKAGRPAPHLSGAVLARLSQHRWPGNVRELRNVIEHAFVMCDGRRIELEHLPEALRGPAGAAEPSGAGVKDKLELIERASIVEALAAENGNQTRAAKRLGMSRRALIYKMAKYDLKR